MTLNVNLTPQLEEMVRQKVSGGLYNSASEVVREALRLMRSIFAAGPQTVNMLGSQALKREQRAPDE